ncbi:MAG: M20/M25/M40 family metallo-hydrolase [Verrucomicrobiales bacterium]
MDLVNIDQIEREFLVELLNTPSPSGWEGDGQALWMKKAAEYADSVESDAYGNAWATLKGQGGPTLMLEAHADEIGFIVKAVDSKGFLSVGPVGGSDRTLVPARKIRIFTDNGPVVGVFGNTAIHLRDTEKDKVPEWKDHYVDVGASTEEAVQKMGIRVGQPAVYVDTCEVLSGGRLVGRALDNRIGGFIMLSILKALAAGPRPIATIVFANAVQEEIGSYGAHMLAHRISPDVAVIFDVTHATDTPGIDNRDHGTVKLGAGPTVSHGMANHGGVVAGLMSVATYEQIALQHEAISRSTRTDVDAVFITKEGIPSALVSIPLRYMHSPTEIVDTKDVDAACRLVCAYARSLNSETRFTARGVNTQKLS